MQASNMWFVLAYLCLVVRVTSCSKWFEGSTARGESNGAKESGHEQRLVRTNKRSTLASSNFSGLNVVQNMCERFYHQSTIKNDILYIYAGVETYVATNNGSQPEGPITIGTNNFMIVVDMDVTWDWAHVSETWINPTRSSLPGNVYVPTIIRGALFAGGPADNKVYIYGGTTSGLNTSFVGFQPPISPQNSMWSYDTVENQWDQYNMTLNTPQRPSAGAAAEAPDQNLAFYLNGEITNGTSTATSGLGSELMSVEGLVIINTTEHTSRNVSTKSLVGSNPRTGGVLQYISGIGSKGVLVAIGGSYRPSLATTTDEIGTLLPMDMIDVFDIKSIYNGGKGTWYTQKATGDIPPGRVEFCSVVATSLDHSSYNIYVYGGRASSTTIFDDIYVLSLPSFIWTRVYIASNPKPRYGHTCHLVGRRQMLTVGGSQSTSFNSCDWEIKGVNVFDMTDLTWGMLFDYGAPDYGVPSLVTAEIGGSSYGSANMTKPSSGFTVSGLAELFMEERLLGNSTNQTSQTGSVKKNLTHILVPSIVGGLLLLITLIFIIWLIRSRRSSHQPRNLLPPLESSDTERNDPETRRATSRSSSSQDAPYDPRNPVGND